MCLAPIFTWHQFLSLRLGELVTLGGLDKSPGRVLMACLVYRTGPSR